MEEPTGQHRGAGLTQEVEMTSELEMQLQSLLANAHTLQGHLRTQVLTLSFNSEVQPYRMKSEKAVGKDYGSLVRFPFTFFV